LAWQSQRRQSLSRAGGLVVIPKRICVGFYPGERPHHPQGMLRQPIPEARTCTCHDTAPAPTEQARTAAIRRHKNPKQNTRLGFLWTRQQGCRGMGCRPIQSKVTNHTPIGFNSRSRAPDLIRAGSVSALTVAVCPKRLWGVQPSHTAPSTCAQTASVARNRPSEISAATSPTTTRTIPAS